MSKGCLNAYSRDCPGKINWAEVQNALECSKNRQKTFFEKMKDSLTPKVDYWYYFGNATFCYYNNIYGTRKYDIARLVD